MIQYYVQVKYKNKYIKLEEEVTKDSITKFETKLYSNELYLSLKKERKNLNSSFTISILIIKEENKEESQYNNQNSFTFCGSASLKDCRYCRVESCSIVQCGNEIINETVREDQFVYLNYNFFRIQLLICVFLIRSVIKSKKQCVIISIMLILIDLLMNVFLKIMIKILVYKL